MNAEIRILKADIAADLKAISEIYEVVTLLDELVSVRKGTILSFRPNEVSGEI